MRSSVKQFQLNDNISRLPIKSVRDEMNCIAELCAITPTADAELRIV
jgi:hypothetical protein